ncbi:succinyldiaminopimelate transaminase [Corynebacterium frankenforstense]|uniref:succinyldiaminopimelate transaminase n=1 Tax=Corynebacterium frankenforstense TaxID=1230998 RepID=UPI00254EA929|nr:succinyldiaminopimelate transaminase [Corynebacterium frankenforstense]MDK6258959.1 succinyldiaminopimelate transaminase [Corynebacterium frankenforstense]
MTRTPLVETLPEFPWDTIAEAKATAAAHPDGMVNLSVGSPVDPPAPGIQLALAEAAGFPGYPATVGTPELREAIVDASARRYAMTGLNASTTPGESSVLPVVGTKEAIAWLPTLLGLGAEDTVVIPELAYPTYEVGACLAGTKMVRSDDPEGVDADSAALFFLNSPSNPTGRVLGVDHLRRVVAWAREHDVIVASDECYLGLGWDDDNEPVSILDERVCDGDHTGLLAIHSLSKTANFAGYRGGFFAGDPGLIAELTQVRKHAGLMVPYPIQAAMTAAYGDDDAEHVQKLRYAVRRAKLLEALIGAGFTVEHSEAGLYLWASLGENGRATVDRLAELGILVAPGEFYGPAGENFVRVGMTADDAHVDEAAQRLRAASAELRAVAGK